MWVLSRVSVAFAFFFPFSTMFRSLQGTVRLSRVSGNALNSTSEVPGSYGMQGVKSCAGSKSGKGEIFHQ